MELGADIESLPCSMQEAVALVHYVEQGSASSFKVSIEPAVTLHKPFGKVEECIEFIVCEKDIALIQRLCQGNQALQALHEPGVLWPGQIQAGFENRQEARCQVLALSTLGSQIGPCGPRTLEVLDKHFQLQVCESALHLLQGVLLLNFPEDHIEPITRLHLLPVARRVVPAEVVQAGTKYVAIKAFCVEYMQGIPPAHPSSAARDREDRVLAMCLRHG